MIETVPFSEIPNSQCGDWRREEDGTLHIRVASEIGEDSALLVAVHELVEQTLCEKRGITCAEVDVFDARYESGRNPGDKSEPGNAPFAPYRREHFFAETIERLMAAELGVDWRQHEEAIEELA